MDNNSLTKQQAYEAMENGEKVTHIYFDQSEYIHIVNGKMFTEDGYRFESGWLERTEEHWLTGWKIYQSY